MSMLRNRFLLFLTIAGFLCTCFHASGQTNGSYGAYSPYSVFGLGDLSREGTAYNKSMGGVGIASNSRRFVNIMNPASVSVRDSSSFMADFGLVQKNTIFRQNDLRSGNNTFNMYNFVISFPVYRSSALMIGITPFSDIGYDISQKQTNPDIIGNTGNITYNTYGEGSVYQMFIGGGVTFWKRLSIGAEGIYYFGNLDKIYNQDFSNTSYGSLKSGYDLMVRGFTGKFGLQYQQPLGNDLALVFGATYKLQTKMRGKTIYYENKNTAEIVDTLVYREMNNGVDNNLKIAGELGVGVSIKQGERWSAEIDYMRSDWRSSGLDSNDGYSVYGASVFSSSVSQSFRAGFEIVPNRNDIRYYLRRCAYRVGAYYEQAYYKLDGNRVDSMGLTFGVTLPVFRWYNGLTIGVDIGQRGSLKTNMIRERYVSFVVGFNIFDIWFQKPRYN